MSDEIAMRFVGGEGQFLPGVPARDLTAAEVERWPEVEASRIYEFVTAPQGEVVVASRPPRKKQTDDPPAEAGVSEETGDE